MKQAEKLDPIRSYVLRRIEERGDDLASASRSLDKNHAYLHQFIYRGTPKVLADDVRRRLARRLDCPERMLTPHQERDDDNFQGSGAVIEMDVRASAGGGSIVDKEDESALWGFPEGWIEIELGAKSSDLRVLTVEGDSMVSEPPSARDILPGDKAVVNIADRLPTPPGIFVVHDGLGLVAKRVEHIPNSDPPAIRILSNNRAYSPYERTLEEAHILGRIVGKWARL